MILDVAAARRAAGGRDPRRAGHLAELDAGLRQGRRGRLGHRRDHVPRRDRRAASTGCRRSSGTGDATTPDQDRRRVARRRRRAAPSRSLRARERTPATTPSWSAAATTRRSSPATSRAQACASACSSAAPHLGGGASTSEGPAPGFLMNHCSALDALLRPPGLPGLRPPRARACGTSSPRRTRG